MTAAVALAALTLTSCASRRVLTEQQLAGEWAVVSLGAENVTPDERTPYLGFEGNRMYGFTGCNRLTGALPEGGIRKGKVDFSKVATTMMTCPDNRYEQKFMDALRNAGEMRLIGGQLVFIADNGRQTMVLARRPFQVTELDGTWDVTELRGAAVTPGEDTPYLTFDMSGRQISGFTGCNRIMGSLDPEKVRAGKPDFSKLGTTRMACPDNSYEATFLSALRATATLMTNGPTMILKGAGGQTLVKLRKRQ